MTRVQIGSFSTSSNSSAAQFITAESPRITYAEFKSHSENSSLVFVGTSSALSSVNGWSFSSGSSFSEIVEITATVKGTMYWGLTPDTTDLIDYVFVLED